MDEAEATGEGIWVFDGRSCQSACLLKNRLSYCEKVLMLKACQLY